MADNFPARNIRVYSLENLPAIFHFSFTQLSTFSIFSEQGEVVRKAKADKLSKDVLDVEIKKLLGLKDSLAISQGIDPKELKKGKSNNKKK